MKDLNTPKLFSKCKLENINSACRRKKVEEKNQNAFDNEKTKEKKTRTFLINIHSIYLHIHATTFLSVILNKKK